MSQFGEDVTNVPILNSATTVKAGVAGPSILEPVTDIFNKASSLLRNDRKTKLDARTEGVLSDFMNKQTSIADSVDQGRYNSAFGRSMMRRNFMTFVNDNPNIRKELIKLQKDIVGTVGIGSIVTKDTEEERLRSEQNSALVREGLADADSSEEEFDIARNRLTTSLEAKRKYTLELQTINLEKSKVGLEASQLGLLEKRESKAAYDYMSGISGVGYDSFKVSMDNLVTQAISGAFSSADVQIQIENQFLAIQAEFAVPLSKLTSTQASALMKPFEKLKEISIAIASGKLEGDAAKQAYDTALNLQKAIAMQDPAIAKAAAVSSIFGNDSAAVQLATKNSVAKFMGINAEKGNPTVANPFTVGAEDTQGFKTYTDALNNVVNNPAASKEDIKELGVHLSKIVEGTSDYEGMLRKDPKSAIKLMDWIGTQGFLKAMKTYPEAFKDIDSMKTIISEHYSNEVWGMVESEFRTGKISIISSSEPEKGRDRNPLKPTRFTIDEEVSTKDVITYNVDGDGTVKFVTSSASGDVKREAARLNKVLAPVISKTARASVHLDGRDDYQKATNEAMEAMLGVAGLKGTASAGEKELDIKDFRIAPEISGESGKLSFLIDSKEGGGDYSTLFGFSQRGGRKFGGIDVTKMTLAEVSNFASTKGDYGKWVKTKVGRVATPMGRYQIVGTTLREVAKEMRLPSSTLFDRTTQDAMFRHLVKRRLSGKTTMSSKLKALRQEWEGFGSVSDADLIAAILEYEGSEGN